MTQLRVRLPYASLFSPVIKNISRITQPKGQLRGSAKWSRVNSIQQNRGSMEVACSSRKLSRVSTWGWKLRAARRYLPCCRALSSLLLHAGGFAGGGTDPPSVISVPPTERLCCRETHHRSALRPTLAPPPALLKSLKTVFKNQSRARRGGGQSPHGAEGAETSDGLGPTETKRQRPVPTTFLSVPGKKIIKC